MGNTLNDFCRGHYATGRSRVMTANFAPHHTEAHRGTPRHTEAHRGTPRHTEAFILRPAKSPALLPDDTTSS